MNNGTTIIIFGFTGDLAKRKLIPALYQLFIKQKLNKSWIIGCALEKTTVQEIVEKAKPFIKEYDQKKLKSFTAIIDYKAINFKHEKDFQMLEKFVTDKEKKETHLKSRLAYFATPADFFCIITRLCAESKLFEKINEQDRFHRLVYEKPFGKGLDSARLINTCIAEFFDESQIYRIDHYLTKEVVGNIAMLRFTNCIFEPLWNKQYIDNIQIILSENVCLEGRGGYYDKFGALCDVVQNHILELLALVAMEAPDKLTGEFIREKRAEVLKAVTFEDGILGQYEQYNQELNSNSHSTTETFAALKLFVNTHRWAGVPFYVKTGKCLDKKETVIHIKFKKVDCLLMKGCPMDSNYLTIKIDPDAVFSLSLNAKKIDSADEVEPVTMDFCHSCIYGALTPQSYEIIFQGVINAEHEMSVRFDEIEYAWQVIEKIKSENLSLSFYKGGSSGPQKELEDFSFKHGMKWKS